MKKNRYIDYMVFISIVLAIICFLIGPEFLFGSKTDWLNQHIVFPDYFRKLFYDTGNLLPNFALQLGAGQNIFNFAYYGLLNPIILLSYFFPFISMTDYIMIAMILVVLTSVMLFYHFLLHHHFSRTVSLVTSIVFACSAPLIFHAHRHIMFVSYMPFLIMGLMGIDRYFERGKQSLLIISTFLMIMTSYFYSVGGIFVLVIYGIYSYLKRHDNITFKRFIMDGIKFFIPIMIAIMMSMLLLLPVFLCLIGGRNGTATSISLMELFLPKLNLDYFLYGSYTLGLTAVAILSLLSLGTSRKKHDLFLTIALSMVFLFPIFIYLLNGGLYVRAKTLIPFIPLMCLVIALFFHKVESHEIHLLPYIIIVLLFNIISYILGNHNIYYLVDSTILLLFLFLSHRFQKKWLFYIPVISISLLVAIIVNQSDNYVLKKDYKAIYGEDVAHFIHETLMNDDTFYRFHNLAYYGDTVNHIYSPNYYQTSLYSSTSNSFYHDFYFNIFKNAMPHRNNILMSQTNHSLFDTFMGVKYIVSNREVPVGYHLVKEKGNIRLYQNDNVFALGYATNKLMGIDEFEMLGYPYQNEALLNYIIIDKNIKAGYQSNIRSMDLKYDVKDHPDIIVKEKKDYTEIQVKKKATIDMILSEALKQQILFLDFELLEAPSCSKEDLWIDINGITNKLTCRSWIYQNGNYHFHYAISSSEGVSKLRVTLQKGVYKIKNTHMKVMDYNEILNDVDEKDEFVVDTKKTKGDYITGTIDVKEDGYFTLTIPYDKGFQIKVDGKKQTYEKVNTSFIGFPIQKGSHQIEITYRAPGFLWGSIISVIGFLGFLLCVSIDLKKDRDDKKAFSRNRHII